MGQRNLSAGKLVARAEANSYKRGAHKERDEARNHEKHMTKTKKEPRCYAESLHSVGEYPFAQVALCSVMTLCSRCNLAKMQRDAVRGGVTLLIKTWPESTVCGEAYTLLTWPR